MNEHTDRRTTHKHKQAFSRPCCRTKTFASVFSNGHYVVHNCGTKQFTHDMNILTNDPQTQAFSRPCSRLCVSLLQWSLCVILFCGIKQFIHDMTMLTDKRPTNTSLFFPVPVAAHRYCISLLQWSLWSIQGAILFCGIRQFIQDIKILTDKRPTNTSLFPSLLPHEDLCVSLLRWSLCSYYTMCPPL